MLKELYIENIAVIEKTKIEFEKGFNILTGETGAGKSVLIGSINAILGERVTRDIVRTGAKKASVVAIFHGVPKKVEALLLKDGYDYDKSEDLIISRDIGSDGRSSCKILDKPCTVSTLKEIVSQMIEIHGQHEGKNLLSNEEHLAYIDTYASLEKQRENYIKSYENLMRAKTLLSNLHLDESEKEERIEMLRYQINEIENANLSPGEEKKLKEEREKAKHSAQIISGIKNASLQFFDQDESENEVQGIITKLFVALEMLEDAGKYYDPVSDVLDKAKNIYYEAEEIGSQILQMLDKFDLDESDIEVTELRLDEIYRLGLKYGGPEEEIFAFLAKAKEELAQIEFADEKKEALSKEIEILEEKTQKIADVLSEKRKQSGNEFVTEIHKELLDLNMAGVVFDYYYEKTKFKKDGQDEIYFLISANPGEEPKPLSKIASGGELSRIMLAIKKVLADRDDFETQIFDEIDTGVSGVAAEKIGLKLKEISKGRQVICVTHLAQIASLADAHMLIEKQTHDKRTFTDVKRLRGEDRVDEIARIIGGKAITELTLANAREMIDLGKKK